MSVQCILIPNGILAPCKRPWDVRTLLTGQTLDIKLIRLGNKLMLLTFPVYMTLTTQRTAKHQIDADRGWFAEGYVGNPMFCRLSNLVLRSLRGWRCMDGGSMRIWTDARVMWTWESGAPDLSLRALVAILLAHSSVFLPFKNILFWIMCICVCVCADIE